jgi:SAM-dependent methyltransferase
MTEILEPGDFYNKRVEIYGLNSKSLGWQSYEQQTLRFDVLTTKLNLENKTILDIGCGFGDLAHYLLKRNVNFKQYIGIDVSENMLDLAEKSFNSKLPVFFSKLDILKNEVIPESDVAIMSGVLNLRQSHLSNSELLDPFLKKIRILVKERFAFNLLTDKVDYQKPHNVHFNSDEVKFLAEKYFSRVEILENYGLYEFTVDAIV